MGAASLRGSKAVAFSFDDGPADATPLALDLLREHGAKATFFLIGSRVLAHPELVRQMVLEGHEVGNHTFNHPRLETLAPTQLVDELRSTSDAIEEIAGVRPRLFRPPYGLHGLAATPIAARLGMTTVRWSVNPKDWAGFDADAIAAAVLEGVGPGDVILLHDGSADGQGDRTATIRALGPLLSRLSADGYELVTVSDLLRQSRRARRTAVVRRRGPLRRLISRSRRLVATSEPHDASEGSTVAP